MIYGFIIEVMIFLFFIFFIIIFLEKINYIKCHLFYLFCEMYNNKKIEKKINKKDLNLYYCIWKASR